MAAPVFGQWYSYSARDSKGQIGRMRVLLGGASSSAVETYSQTLKGLLAAVSNAHIYLPNQDGPDRTYGTTASYPDVEDKAVLVFSDPAGYLHKYQVSAPKAAGFQVDGETVLATETNMAALIAGFVANVYGRVTDTAPLAYIGGTRLRRRMIRRYNILTKDPTLTGPGE